MITEADIDFVRYCAMQEAEAAYDALDKLLNTLLLLQLGNTKEYRILSEARTELKKTTGKGLQAFEEEQEEQVNEESLENWWES